MTYSTDMSPLRINTGMQIDATTGRQRVVTCPVCGAQNLHARFTISEMAIESCTACGLVLQNPQPSDSELASIYGNNYFIGSSENDRYASQFEVVKRATARLQLDEIDAYCEQLGFAKRRGRLLEIGCGHGNFLLEARAQGYQVAGLEYSADAAQKANQNLAAELVRVGAVGQTPLPENWYDICVLADVIEHVRDPKDFLQHVWHVLRPDGVVFIATPSTDSWSARMLGRRWMEFKPEHLFYFDRETIRRFLTNAGFSEISVTSGKKVLTLDYIIGHFEKFPVSVISPALRVARALTPRPVLDVPRTITASGINVLATKR
jgi:2-polyprenyl-3-methyl-5-hydroxy-6-metoxy-1,4-benzoquinol methylase